MGDTSSSKCTFVVCHGDDVSNAVSDIREKVACDIFDITSIDDLITFLNNNHLTALNSTDDSSRMNLEQIIKAIQRNETPDNAAHPEVQPRQIQKRSLKTLHDIEKQHIIKMLNQYNWKYKVAAQALGINRTTLYRKIKKYDISPESIK